jgi:alpha-1,6-mannosyltransferase
MAAVAVKASAGLLLPVVLCGARRRLRVLGGMVVGLVVLGGASVYAFGAHLPNLAQQSTLVTLVGLPNVIGYLLGYGGETDTMKLVLAGILLAAVAGVSIWTWRTRDWVRGAGYATVAVLVTLSWTLPWYVLWLLPFAALARGRGLRIAALVISLYLMLAWVPLMTNLIHSFGFKPSLTELGQKRQAKTLLLLH